MTRRDGFLTEHDLRSGLREQYIVARPAARIKIELGIDPDSGFRVTRIISYTDQRDDHVTVTRHPGLTEARDRFTREVRTAPHASLEGTDQ